MDKLDESRERTRELLINHYSAYPKIGISDVFKFLHQSALGCGHLVTSMSSALERIEREYAQVTESVPKAEPLDGDYFRVHLSCLKNGLSARTLARLFYLSAVPEYEGKTRLREKLEVMRELISEGTLPFDTHSFDSELSVWSDADYPPIHHSDAFRSEYRPAYRVIAKRYADYLQLFTKIDTLLANSDVTVAIEGGSASGKTTLSDILREVYDCNIFHMDDFFLRPEQRTEERLREVGGNIDRERFSQEVLTSLKCREVVRYRKFDCRAQALGEEVTAPKKQLNIVEGVYSTHPAFGRYFDLSVFLDIDAEYQKKRIIERNSHYFAERALHEWIPMENEYFEKAEIKKRSDLIITILERG